MKWDIFGCYQITNFIRRYIQHIYIYSVFHRFTHFSYIYHIQIYQQICRYFCLKFKFSMFCVCFFFCFFILVCLFVCCTLKIAQTKTNKTKLQNSGESCEVFRKRYRALKHLKSFHFNFTLSSLSYCVVYFSLFIFSHMFALLVLYVLLCVLSSYKNNKMASLSTKHLICWDVSYYVSSFLMLLFDWEYFSRLSWSYWTIVDVIYISIFTSKFPNIFLLFFFQIFPLWKWHFCLFCFCFVSYFRMFVIIFVLWLCDNFM